MHEIVASNRFMTLATADADGLPWASPVWYAPDNLAFRMLVDRATAKRLAPLLSVIVRQGVDEHRFATSHPEQAGAIIVALAAAWGPETRDASALDDEPGNGAAAATHQ